MKLDVKGTKAFWTANDASLEFDVEMAEHDHLDLKTGEVFQSASYARGRKQQDKAIAATLFVSKEQQSTKGDPIPSEMRYMPGHGEREPEIWISWRIPDARMRELYELVMAGRIPTKAHVGFPLDQLEFGWEPDGSGQNWDNEQHRAIPVESVSFNFDLSTLSSDAPLNGDVHESSDRASLSDEASVNFVIIRKLTAIERAVQGLAATVGIIALLAGVAVWYLRQ